MNEKFLKLLKVANSVKNAFGVSHYEVYSYDDGSSDVIIRIKKAINLNKLSKMVDDFPAIIYAEDDEIVIRIDCE